MSQVSILQVTGPASSAGTSLGTTPQVETASWDRVNGINAIPPGGAMLEIVADGGVPIRFAVMPPSDSNVTPPHNGEIIQAGASVRRLITSIARVWTKSL